MKQEAERIFRRLEQRLINLQVARAAVHQMITFRFPEHHCPHRLRWLAHVDDLFVEHGVAHGALARAMADLLDHADLRRVHYLDA